MSSSAATSKKMDNRATLRKGAAALATADELKGLSAMAERRKKLNDFDIEYACSDGFTNAKFLSMINKLVKKHDAAAQSMTSFGGSSMRGFLSAIHGFNLVLQSRTYVFRIATGSLSEFQKVAETEMKTNPQWFLTYGPVGDLPMHITLLLGKMDLVKEMVTKLEGLEGEMLQAYWEQCRLIHDKYPKTTEAIPDKRDAHALVKWIINLPYQSDIQWWFREIERREQVGADGYAEIARKFKSYVPQTKWEEVLRNDCGLFTGETLLHIAISSLNRETVAWLINKGARFDSRTVGIFFQPSHIPILSDNRTKWFWQKKIEKNERAGCYYGHLPLSFAASLGAMELVKMIVEHAGKVIEREAVSTQIRETANLENVRNRFTEWLDEQGAHLIEESEDYEKQVSAMVASRRSAEADDVKPCPDVTLSPGVTRQLCSRKVAFMNVPDEHGNTALHMAVAFGRQEMVQYLMQNGASPSMTLMNAQDRTPFTLALSRPQMFNCVLNAAKETVWQFGDSEMTLQSLYHIDSFRVLESKKADEPAKQIELNEDKAEASADIQVEAGGGVGCDGVTFSNLDGRQCDAGISKIADPAESFNMEHKSESARRVFKLHARKNWKSALELVVEKEMYVLKDIPIFEQLIYEKWQEFGFRYHLYYSCLPYILYFICFNISALLRVADVEDAFYDTDDGNLRAQNKYFNQTATNYEGSPLSNSTSKVRLEDIRNTYEIGSRVFLDVVVYIVMPPWIALRAWQENYFFSARLDANDDLDISWWEFTMYVYKSLGSIVYATQVMLVWTVGVIRLCEPDGWFTLPGAAGRQEREARGEWPNAPAAASEASEGLIAYELNVLSVCAIFTWMNLLVLMLPFRSVGRLLLTIYDMLVGNVLTWFMVYLVFLGGWAVATYIAVVMSDTPRASTPCAAELYSRDVSLASLTFEYTFQTTGDVRPGGYAGVARSSTLIYLYNITFLFFTCTVLVNLLIALMGNTFSRHQQRGRQMWWLQFASLVLQLEKRLPDSKKEIYRSGEAVGEPSDKGCCEYYLVSVHDKNKSKSDFTKYGETHLDAYAGTDASNGEFTKYRGNESDSDSEEVDENEMRDFIAPLIQDVTDVKNQLHGVEDKIDDVTRHLQLLTDRLLRATSTQAGVSLAEGVTPQPVADALLANPRGGQGHESTSHSHILHRIGEYMHIVRNCGWSDSEKTTTLTTLLRQEQDAKVLQCFKGQGHWQGTGQDDATAHLTAIPDWGCVLEKLEQLSTDMQVGGGVGGHAGGQTGGHAGGQTGRKTSSQATSFAGKSYPLPPLFRSAAATLAVESPGKCEGDKKFADAGNGGGSDVSSIRQQTSADVSRRQQTSALEGGSSDGLQTEIHNAGNGDQSHPPSIPPPARDARPRRREDRASRRARASLDGPPSKAPTSLGGQVTGADI